MVIGVAVGTAVFVGIGVLVGAGVGVPVGVAVNVGAGVEEGSKMLVGEGVTVGSGAERGEHAASSSTRTMTGRGMFFMVTLVIPFRMLFNSRESAGLPD